MPVELPGWGTHRVPVWPGRHLVQVYVAYAIPRKAGRALTEVTLAPGQEVRLEYMAPTVTFASGSLGAPGEQRSAGASLVRALNIAALALAVVGAFVWLVS